RFRLRGNSTARNQNKKAPLHHTGERGPLRSGLRHNGRQPPHRYNSDQITRAAVTRRTTVQDLLRLIGRPSAISTVSPSLYWLVSSCALYLPERMVHLL